MYVFIYTYIYIYIYIHICIYIYVYIHIYIYIYYTYAYTYIPPRKFAAGPTVNFTTLPPAPRQANILAPNVRDEGETFGLLERVNQ